MALATTPAAAALAAAVFSAAAVSQQLVQLDGPMPQLDLVSLLALWLLLLLLLNVTTLMVPVAVSLLLESVVHCADDDAS
jgi:hypothetical protein